MVLVEITYHLVLFILLMYDTVLPTGDDNVIIFCQVLEQRVETLERELDAAITSAAHARSEKRQAEAAQRAAEVHVQEVTKELENTTSTKYLTFFHSLLLIFLTVSPF